MSSQVRIISRCFGKLVELILFVGFGQNKCFRAFVNISLFIYGGRVKPVLAVVVYQSYCFVLIVSILDFLKS